MIRIPHVVLFFPDKEKGKEDALLRCRVKWDGSRRIVSLSVGYRISLDRWDYETQSCIKGSYHSKRRTPASTINAEIDKFRRAVASVIRSFEESDVFPGVAKMRQSLDEALGLGRQRQDTLVSSLLLSYISEQGSLNSWTDSTYKAMNNMRNHLLAFDAGLRIEDVSTDTLTRYTDFLRRDVVGPDGSVSKQGLSNSTLTRQLGYLRCFLRWADARQLMKSRDYLTFKPRIKTIPSKVVFLEWDELMAVYELKFTMAEAFLEKFRDIFCFSCFTSLRFSDVMNLRWSDIHSNVMTVTTVKTADPVRIELNSYAREIIGKYAEEEFPDNRVFPPVVNQVMNRYLREIGQKAGIDSPVHRTWFKGNERREEVVPKWQLLTSHCGRRTFICHALSMGIAPNVVMKWTGHADYNSMRPYIAISQAATEEAMKRFDGR